MLYGKEGTFATTVDPANTINFLLRFEATTTENRVEEPVIGGGRDLFGRVWTMQEVAGVIEQQPLSGALLQYVLGTVANTTTSPYVHTLVPDTVVPSFTAIRAVRSPDEFIQYVGCKVDSAEITCEAEEDVRFVFNFVAQSASTISDSWSAPGLDATANPFAYYHGEVLYKGETMGNVQRVVIEFNNNLEARYAVGGTLTPAYGAQEIREGAFEVSGRILFGYPLGSLANEVFTARNTVGVTLQVTLGKTTYPGATIQFNFPNIAFGEFADEVVGADIYEVEIPFTARAIGTADIQRAVYVVHTGLKGTFDDYVA